MLALGIPTIAPKTGTFPENTATEGQFILYENMDDLKHVLKLAQRISDSEHSTIRQSVLARSATYSTTETARRLSKIFGV